jgi:hypothetical protein
MSQHMGRALLLRRLIQTPLYPILFTQAVGQPKEQLLHLSQTAPLDSSGWLVA